jgi:hypothetical protein
VAEERDGCGAQCGPEDGTVLLCALAIGSAGAEAAAPWNSRRSAGRGPLAPPEAAAAMAAATMAGPGGLLPGCRGGTPPPGPPPDSATMVERAAITAAAKPDVAAVPPISACWEDRRRPREPVRPVTPDALRLGGPPGPAGSVSQAEYRLGAVWEAVRQVLMLLALPRSTPCEGWELRVRSTPPRAVTEGRVAVGAEARSGAVLVGTDDADVRSLRAPGGRASGGRARPEGQGRGGAVAGGRVGERVRRPTMGGTGVRRARLQARRALHRPWIRAPAGPVV